MIYRLYVIIHKIILSASLAIIINVSFIKYEANWHR